MSLFVGRFIYYMFYVFSSVSASERTFDDDDDDFLGQKQSGLSESSRPAASPDQTKTEAKTKWQKDKYGRKYTTD